MMQRFLEWWRVFGELLLPAAPSCPFCQERQASPLGCCVRCFDSLAIDWKMAQSRGYPYYSLLPYQGFARDLIHRMKYQGGYEIATAFGFLLALALKEEPALNDLHYLVPVPLHLQRLEERGFNQAALIADSISGSWQRPLYKGVVRVKKTPSQSGLSFQKRQLNLKGAFQILPGHSFAGKKYLIVDDVITSGSTFNSLAQLIADYGGVPMGVFVARTKIH